MPGPSFRLCCNPNLPALLLSFLTTPAIPIRRCLDSELDAVGDVKMPYLPRFLTFGCRVKGFDGLVRTFVGFRASFAFSKSVCSTFGFFENSLSSRFIHILLFLPHTALRDLTRPFPPLAITSILMFAKQRLADPSTASQIPQALETQPPTPPSPRQWSISSGHT
jgi:hypothetical protein